RCMSLQAADGGAVSSSERLRYQRLGEPEACSVLGAEKLRCLSTHFSACAAAFADGGALAAEAVALSGLASCTNLLGDRFDTTCSDFCFSTRDLCSRACPRTDIEACSACAFECGRAYIGCARGCLVLPDGGYPDAGR
ncbi:MAG: hypothetical protein JNG84_02155, partial [Archangium sp.]|nr:hypothetical protein [Archangium sp.]